MLLFHHHSSYNNDIFHYNYLFNIEKNFDIESFNFGFNQQ